MIAITIIVVLAMQDCGGWLEGALGQPSAVEPWQGSGEQNESPRIHRPTARIYRAHDRQSGVHGSE
jgi:hypothetical protein